MSHRVDGRDSAVPADAHLVTDLPTTLSKIEQGYIYPSMRIRKKLAKALGVGPQELSRRCTARALRCDFGTRLRIAKLPVTSSQ
jgi:transcriptional regulator with XRE-family HTH domain